MAIQALLPMLGMMGSGALGGISSKLGAGKQKKPEALLTPEQKSQMSASQALIPFYLQLISGQMPDYLRRYLMQTQSAVGQQTRGNISELLRAAGGAGRDFGPETISSIGRMLEGQTPALTRGLSEARANLTGKGIQGFQEWSMIQPKWWERPDKQPSMGQMAGAGATGGFASWMGGLNTGGSPKAGGMKYPGAPYTPQYTQSAASNAYGDVMSKMAPNLPPGFPTGMYPIATQNVNPSGFTNMSGGGNYGPAIYPGKK